MKQLLPILTLLCIPVFALPQEEVPTVLHENQIKAGISSHINVFIYDHYDGYYYDYPGNHEPIATLQLFLAYEHIWQFPKSIAFALEPKAGLALGKNNANGFAGLNTKFYWANKKIWRMGIAVYGGYGYAKREVSIDVPMEGGDYYQIKELDMHFHSFSFDIGLIPFQFRFQGAPLTVEAVFALGGFSVINGRSEPYTDGYNNERTIIDNYALPYILKGELKIGFVLP